MSKRISNEKSGEAAAESNSNRSVDNPETEPESISNRWAKGVWAAGSYEEIASKYASMGGHLVKRTDVGSDDEVLDVGCGTGTVALTAAQRDARVTGVDIQPELLARARANADLAGIDVSWREGNATALPFETNTFDITLSNLGHMYGDPPDAAARELLRVTQPEGRIGFTSWTATSLYPAMAGVVTTFLEPEDLPDFSEPPFLWGDSGTVQDRLGESVTDLEFETETILYPALSPEHFWKQTATNSGMFIEILDDVADEDLPDLREQLVRTIKPYFDDRENGVELEYLLTTATVTTSE